MTTKLTVLIIEDEKTISSFIETAISTGPYKTLKAATGREGLSMITSCCPDVILLDLGLPDMDGLVIIKQVREFSPVPIIVISARTQEKEKVTALDYGADDYLTKPFGASELMARIRTAIRHSSLQNDSHKNKVYSVDGLVIDFEKRLVTVNGDIVHLTQIEYKLVSLLAQNAGKILTYDSIIKYIWGPYADSNNQILRVNMAHIRRKIEEKPAEPKYIYTEIGVGYRMKA